MAELAVRLSAGATHKSAELPQGSVLQNLYAAFPIGQKVYLKVYAQVTNREPLSPYYPGVLDNERRDSTGSRDSRGHKNDS